MAAPWKGKKRKISSTQAVLVDLTNDSDEDKQAIELISDSDEEVEYVGAAKKEATTPSKRGPPSKTINDILKDASVGTGAPARSLPPLLLTTPEQVAKHTPCTLHLNFLPAELAERLFRTMLRESNDWLVPKMHINDREVTSAHTTGFYSSDPDQDTSHWYRGKKQSDYFSKPLVFNPEMIEAKALIDKFVNDQLAGTARSALEFDGPWQANVAAANNYKGANGTVGAHSDQMTYLGPCPTIASVSLGVTRVFRLRAVPTLQDPAAPPPRTYDVRLPHNSLCIMKAGCQEHFKHSVPPARSIDLFKLKMADGTLETFVDRINITFRFYRPDFGPATTPYCKCGVPTVLRADAKGKAAARLASATGSIDQTMHYFWQCTAGSANDGKTCNYFKLLDMVGEGRGPCIGDRPAGSALDP